MLSEWRSRLFIAGGRLGAPDTSLRSLLLITSQYNILRLNLIFNQGISNRKPGLIPDSSRQTNAQNPVGANYLAVPGSVRRFATFEMLRLMLNAAGIWQDPDYQTLLTEWGHKHNGRNRLRNPHRLFALLNDRGRNSRVR